MLGLDSTLKSAPRGFGEYYTRRERRLVALTEGWINTAVDHVPCGTGGNLTLRIEDSGLGFDYQQHLPELVANTVYNGRGVPLVRSLCQELVYSGKENTVQAV